MRPNHALLVALSLVTVVALGGGRDPAPQSSYDDARPAGHEPGSAVSASPVTAATLVAPHTVPQPTTPGAEPANGRIGVAGLSHKTAPAAQGSSGDKRTDSLFLSNCSFLC